MILARANKIPPFVVRLLARDSRKGNGWHALTTLQIAEASGIAPSTVKKISLLKSWATIQIETADAFAKACGVDLMRPAVHLRYLRRRKLAHLRFASPAQRKLFAKLLATRA